MPLNIPEYNYLNAGQAIEQGNRNALMEAQLREMPQQQAFQRQQNQNVLAQQDQSMQAEKIKQGIAYVRSRVPVVQDQMSWDAVRGDFIQKNLFTDQELPKAYDPAIIQRLMSLGQSQPSTPASVQETQWYLGQPQDVQSTHTMLKRANQIMNLNDRMVALDAQGNPVKEYPKGLPPEKTPENITAATNAQVMAQKGGISLTPGEQKVDEAFAKEYTEFVAAGGYSDVAKNLNQLAPVLKDLESGKKNLSGGYVGLTPDSALNYINPEAANAKQQVEEVVQRNLRLILGAQFTEKEGERLIGRAYNDKLDEKTNATRVRRLLSQIKEAAMAKQRAADYFQKNGTLKGFKGKVWTKDDFLSDIEDAPSETGSKNSKGWPLMIDAQGNRAYVGPNNEIEEVE